MNRTISRVRGAIIYTRVSTGEQDKHGTSPETQLDACRKKAQDLSLRIVAEYYDGGVSGGFLTSRPGMQSALADIKGGLADTLLCPNISRYSRDVEHQQAIKKAVRAVGGRLVFCDADFEDTPAGDLNFTIQGSFAEYEKAMIRERLMGGKRKKAQQGFQANRGNPPFGYHVPTKDDVMRSDYPLEQLGKYVLIPEQAEVVRWMFEEYATGRQTLPEIAREMNKRGIPTKRGGLHWRAVNFAYIFANPVYKGQPVAGRWQSRKDEARLSETNRLTGEPIVSSHSYWLAEPENWIPLDAPAIVSEETWERVQVRLKVNKSKRSGNPLTLKMLSGYIFCPECNAPMVTTYGPGCQRYICSGYKYARQDKGEVFCVKTRYSAPMVEQATCKALLDACARPKAVQAAITAYERSLMAPAASADPRRELAQIDKAILQLATEEAATVQAQIAGIRAGASPDVYATVFADIAARRKDFEDRRGTLTISLRSKKSIRFAVQSEATWTEMLTKAREVLESPDVAGAVKRKILGTVIERVVCDKMGATVYFLPGVVGNQATLQNVRTS
ncbi:MAG: recombinase family protein [Janthinobacterium lividum]